MYGSIDRLTDYLETSNRVLYGGRHEKFYEMLSTPSTLRITLVLEFAYAMVTRSGLGAWL